ncbi:MAG: hypothetical protein ACI906_002990 [Candidatus Latescibacterota bacterium]
MSDTHTLFLRQVNAPLKIRSRTLGELWLVPDHYDISTLDAPTYTHDECRLIIALDLHISELKALHLAKKHFTGDLILAADTESLRQLYRRWLAAYREEERLLQEGEGGDEERFLKLARRLSLLEKKAAELEEDE